MDGAICKIASWSILKNFMFVSVHCNALMGHQDFKIIKSLTLSSWSNMSYFDKFERRPDSEFAHSFVHKDIAFVKFNHALFFDMPIYTIIFLEFYK